jgi:transcriptional regulator with XRE-family HTH domain
MSNARIRCNPAFVRSLRKSDWTQEYVANRLGVDERTVRRMENGEPVSAYLLDCLGKLYDVDPMKLLFHPFERAYSMLMLFARHQRNTVVEAADKGLISEKIRFEIEGKEYKIPIGGAFRGIGGCGDFLDTYFGLFDRSKAAPKIINVCEDQPGERVIIKAKETVCGRWRRSKPVSFILTLTFTFDEHLQLVKLEDAYDTTLLLFYLNMIRHTPKRFHRS